MFSLAYIGGSGSLHIGAHCLKTILVRSDLRFWDERVGTDYFESELWFEKSEVLRRWL